MVMEFIMATIIDIGIIIFVFLSFYYFTKFAKNNYEIKVKKRIALLLLTFGLISLFIKNFYFDNGTYVSAIDISIGFASMYSGLELFGIKK